MANEQFLLLQSLPLFHSLEEEDIHTIASFCTVHHHKAGDVLFYEKDSKDAIFYIISGSVKFYKVDRFDNEIFLYKLYSNSLIFNVSKLIDSFFISCYANAEFLEDSTILHIKKHSVSRDDLCQSTVNEKNFRRVIFYDSTNAVYY
ncbi:MAG: cyclic nucleotide-binding domain-containing protein [Sulfurospirillum sp.]|nr:cyclic nucleotide-binding domain-containing protein [Sulfurospirillum sp.]